MRTLEELKAAAAKLTTESPADEREALASEVRELLASEAHNSQADIQQMLDLLNPKGEDGDALRAAYENTNVMTADPVSILAAAGDDSDKGYTWDIRIVKYGLTVNKKDFYAEQALRAGVGAYEGMRVFALEESQHQGTAKPFGKSSKEIVGWVDNVYAGADGLYGKFHIIKSAQWLRDGVLSAWEKGKKDLFAFSNDITGIVSRKTVEGKQVRCLEKVVSAQLDVVYEPIAGGEFLRMVAAREHGGKEHEMIEKLLAALKDKRPGEYDKLKTRIDAGEVIKDDEIIGLLAGGKPEEASPSKCPKCGTKIEDGDKFCAGCGKSVESMKGAVLVVDGGGDLAKDIEELRKSSSASLLRAALAEAKDLPEATIEKLRAAHTGQVFTEEQLTASIRTEREYLGKVAGGGGLEDLGGKRVDVTGQPERLQAALDKTLGLTVEDDPKFKDVSAFEGLRAAYARITGDVNVTGRAENFSKEYLRAAGDGGSGINSGSFPILLGNTMYRRLLAEYRRRTYDLERVLTFTRRATDYKTMQTINVGYFSDMAVLNPETADYPEINSSAIGEDVVSYNMALRGLLLTITRMTILNDDLGGVQKLVQRLGRMATRVRAKNAWNLLVGNAVYQPDGLPVFHANHGNLSTTAIGPIGSVTQAAAAAAITAMVTQLANQTEPASGEVLGLDFFKDMKLCLVVSNAQWDAAKVLNQSQYLDNTFKANPVYKMFGENNENIVVLPFLTDTGATHTLDFFVLGDPSEREMIEAAYLNGLEEPQLFVADIPTIGQMFVADKIQYKMRHEYQDVVVEYRNMTKAVVTG